ncbi:MAG TPA: hypothetical protein VGG98_07970 [Solirubrobacteraceae bacterium]
MSTEATAILAPVVESVPCAHCGASLALDQRYCLECGARRTEARSQFLDGLGAPTAAVRGAPVAGPLRERAPWSAPWGGASTIAAVGVLLLAMGVGVLIGRSGSTKTVTAPAQVLSVATPGASAGTRALGSPSASSVTSTAFSDDWPAGKNGYTVQLQTLQAAGTQPTDVVAAKAAATAKGAQGVGALRSDDYRGLPSGLYVIYSGVYSTPSQARQALGSLKKSFPAATVTHVAGASGASPPSTAAGAGAAGGGKGSTPGGGAGAPSTKGTSAPGSGQGNEQKSLHLPNVVSTG